MPSTVPSTGPKVNLPSIQQAQSTPLLTASDTIPRNEPASIKSGPLQLHQLHIPKSVPLAKAVHVLDIESLEALAGDRVRVEVDYASRLVKFEVLQDTPSARKVCLTCLQVAVSALTEACAPEAYTEADDATLLFLGVGSESTKVR